MQQSTTPNYFSFVSNLMQQFKMPNFDYSAFLEARRKDFDALTTLNRIAVKGIEAAAIKQAEIVRNTVEDVQLVMQQLMSVGNGGKVASSSQAIQQALQKTFASVQELADAAQESRAEAFEVVKSRVEHNVEELKALAESRK